LPQAMEGYGQIIEDGGEIRLACASPTEQRDSIAIVALALIQLPQVVQRQSIVWINIQMPEK